MGIADYIGGQRRIDFERQLDLLFEGLAIKHHAHPLDFVGETHRSRFEFDLAGPEGRVDQNIFDHRQQQVGRSADHFDQPRLAAAERAFGQDIDQSDHAVHRRAHLVTYRGKKLGLGASRRIDSFAELPQLQSLFSQLLVTRNVAGHILDLNQAAAVSGAVREWRH